MVHRFNARIERSGDMDAAYVVGSIDIREVYGVGRLKVEVTLKAVLLTRIAMN